MILSYNRRRRLGDYDGGPEGTILTAPAPDQAAIDSYATAIVRLIDGVVPDDNLYAPDALSYVRVLANLYNGAAAQDSRVRQALSRAQTRYQFVKNHYPGVTVLPDNATLPSGSTPRWPILIAFADGSFGYAPGYGPVAQYGATQVASSTVPPSDRISAYTGEKVGVVGQNDIQGPLVGPTPGSGTWGGTDPTTGPGYAPDAPPPPDGYPGPITYTNPPPAADGSESGAATMIPMLGIGALILGVLFFIGRK